MTAKFSGRDLSGQRVYPLAQVDADEGRKMSAEFQGFRCEHRGCERVMAPSADRNDHISGTRHVGRCVVCGWYVDAGIPCAECGGIVPVAPFDHDAPADDADTFADCEYRA
jgi:hypothetical protein